MSSTEVTILSRSLFVDRTNAAKPVNMTRLVYQLPDARIGNVTILAADVGTPKEDEAIAKSIKALPASAIERKEIKL